ncbi:unnamed protein product [Polarella glacialis]|uniref:Uncharacterized protein n=1 Tax=Polarella glacialis TaxID=89957 RepID=A0A813EBE0_POLGL|nr:unnamed protein product [Polarella glacialis]
MKEDCIPLRWNGWRHALDSELYFAKGELPWKALQDKLVGHYLAATPSPDDSDSQIGCYALASIPEAYLSRVDSAVCLPCLARLRRHAERFAKCSRPERIVAKYAVASLSWSRSALLRYTTHVAAWVAFIPQETGGFEAARRLLGQLLQRQPGRSQRLRAALGLAAARLEGREGGGAAKQLHVQGRCRVFSHIRKQLGPRLFPAASDTTAELLSELEECEERRKKPRELSRQRPEDRNCTGHPEGNVDRDLRTNFRDLDVRDVLHIEPTTSDHHSSSFFGTHAPHQTSDSHFNAAEREQSLKGQGPQHSGRLSTESKQLATIDSGMPISCAMKLTLEVKDAASFIGAGRHTAEFAMLAARWQNEAAFAGKEARVGALEEKLEAALQNGDKASLDTILCDAASALGPPRSAARLGQSC